MHQYRFMSHATRTVTLFPAGDVMTGRGIDQTLPQPGDLRAELERMAPDARIVNLETAVTASGEPWPRKGIHYRMNPANVPCLTAAGLDCCVLANDHVMDWGRAGLAETLAALRAAGPQHPGVDVVHGHSSHHAQDIEIHRNRPVLYGCGDLTFDYEGIEGYEAYRPELSVMYFPTFDADSGRLLEFALVPMRLRRMRLERAAQDDAAWLRVALGRLGTRLEARGDGTLSLRLG